MCRPYVNIYKLIQKENQDNNYHGLRRFNRKIPLLKSKLNTELRKKQVRCYVWIIALYGSETWKLTEFERKYLSTFRALKYGDRGEWRR